MRSQKLGDAALRFARPANVDARSILDAARAWPGVVDVVLTESWIGIAFAVGARAEIDDARIDALAHLPASEDARRALVEIEVRYDGADLDELAATLGIRVERIIELHSHAEYTVLFLGFQPGFAYLGGLPRELHVPRRATPRARVPKNAVAIAGAYAGVYPFEGPGGWNVIGTATNIELFDRERGAMLQAGDRVRFVPKR